MKRRSLFWFNVHVCISVGTLLDATKSVANSQRKKSRSIFANAYKNFGWLENYSGPCSVQFSALRMAFQTFQLRAHRLRFLSSLWLRAQRSITSSNIEIRMYFQRFVHLARVLLFRLSICSKCQRVLNGWSRTFTFRHLVYLARCLVFISAFVPRDIGYLMVGTVHLVFMICLHCILIIVSSANWISKSSSQACGYAVSSFIKLMDQRGVLSSVKISEQRVKSVVIM